MFEFVRTHTRLLQFLLALLVFPSFILFGVQGYNRMTEGGNATVAKVDGHAITLADWEQAQQRQVERMRAQSPNLDAKVFDTPQAKRQVFDALVRERVLATAADRLHMSATNDQVVHALLTMPDLAMLRNADGTFDRAKYTELLAAQGMSPAMFEARLRDDLSVQQVLEGVTGSVVAPPVVALASLDALLQSREVQVQRFDTKDYLARITPTDAEIDAYYKNPVNQAQFRAPEQATIEYAVLDLDALAKGITVSDKDLQDYYNTNISKYSVPEERRAAHILVKADKDMPAADRAKAKAKAESLLAEVRKNPAQFADIAKKNSEDPGSKDQGGELGFFTRDAMVKPFADAAFGMKPGDISDVVQSDFGYHIIKLEEARGGDKKSFDSVKASISDDVKKQLAQRKYAEAAEQFTNTVYEQSDSLQPVIGKLKLDRKTATVQHSPQPGTGPLSSAKFINALFASDSVEKKRNTEGVEFAPNQMVSGRILQYTPAHVPPLAEVKDKVRSIVISTQAAALARKDGESRLARLKSNPTDLAGLAQPVQVSRPKPGELPPPVVDQVLRADTTKLPVDLGVDLGSQGYMVARLDRVLPPDATSPEVKALIPRYGQAWASAESLAYLAALKSRYKAEIKPEAEKIEAADAASSPAH